MYFVRAFAISVLFGVAACSIGSAETVPYAHACQASDESMVSDLRQPGSPMELLQNIKILMASNALVRESSFTEKALTQSLGAVAFQWFGRPGLRMVNMRRFVSMPSGTANGFSIYASHDSNFEGTSTQQGKVIVTYNENSVRTDALIPLFGESYTLGLPRSGPIAAPTDPHGNKVYVYDLVCGDVHTWLALHLDSGGDLHELSLTQRGQV